jgi:hypothetical protein
MGFLRKPPLGLMTPTVHKCAVGFMLADAPPPDSPQPSSGLLARLSAAIGLSGRVGLTSISRTAKDPTLPVLLLGAIGAAFFATVVLHAPAEIVFGLLFIGCLTAILETKMHNDDRDRR